MVKAKGICFLIYLATTGLNGHKITRKLGHHKSKNPKKADVNDQLHQEPPVVSDLPRDAVKVDKIIEGGLDGGNEGLSQDEHILPMAEVDGKNVSQLEDAIGYTFSKETSKDGKIIKKGSPDDGGGGCNCSSGLTVEHVLEFLKTRLKEEEEMEKIIIENIFMFLRTRLKKEERLENLITDASGKALDPPKPSGRTLDSVKTEKLVDGSSVSYGAIDSLKADKVMDAEEKAEKKIKHHKQSISLKDLKENDSFELTEQAGPVKEGKKIVFIDFGAKSEEKKENAANVAKEKMYMGVIADEVQDEKNNELFSKGVNSEEKGEVTTNEEKEEEANDVTADRAKEEEKRKPTAGREKEEKKSKMMAFISDGAREEEKNELTSNEVKEEEKKELITDGAIVERKTILTTFGAQDEDDKKVIADRAKEKGKNSLTIGEAKEREKKEYTADEVKEEKKDEVIDVEVKEKDTKESTTDGEKEDQKILTGDGAKQEGKKELAADGAIERDMKGPTDNGAKEQGKRELSKEKVKMEHTADGAKEEDKKDLTADGIKDKKYKIYRGHQRLRKHKKHRGNLNSDMEEKNVHSNKDPKAENVKEGKGWTAANSIDDDYAIVEETDSFEEIESLPLAMSVTENKEDLKHGDKEDFLDSKLKVDTFSVEDRVTG